MDSGVSLGTYRQRSRYVSRSGTGNQFASPRSTFPKLVRLVAVEFRTGFLASNAGGQVCRMSEHGKHTQSHIDLIARQEHEFLSQLSLSGWMRDRIASFAGNIYFVLLHAVIVIFWVFVNAGRLPGIPKFDPYPYSLLGTIVAVEAVFLASFILMRQTRMRGGRSAGIISISRST